jgi:FtsZ-binding cell division protein ZapB
MNADYNPTARRSLELEMQSLKNQISFSQSRARQLGGKFEEWENQY